VTEPVLGDRVELRGLQVLALCGVLPEERVRRQPFEIDLDVYRDLRDAGATDDLERTVDYGALCQALDDLSASEQYGLLERFAARIAEVVLADSTIDAVTVSVRKLRPPVPQLLATSGVSIHRRRPS
jgi:7,8-dihydroneopterin aldolase/epimerase/oxygenase